MTTHVQADLENAIQQMAVLDDEMHAIQQRMTGQLDQKLAKEEQARCGSGGAHPVRCDEDHNSNPWRPLSAALLLESVFGPLLPASSNRLCLHDAAVVPHAIPHWPEKPISMFLLP